MIASSPDWRHSIETLWDLEATRAIHRFDRFRQRIRSPRHAVGMILAISFVALYLLAGLTILARRDPVAPERLRLWLSGGMVVYAIYHGLKSLLTSPPDGKKSGDPSTAAFGLWIGGGPIPRQLVSLQDVIRLFPATAMKTSLLCVVLFRDVPSVICLWVGVFLAMFTLEWIRRIVSQVIDALNTRELFVMRLSGVFVALALLTQFSLQTWNATPAGGDPAEYMASGIGVITNFAMSAPVQLLATPLQSAAHLAVVRPFSWMIAIIPASYFPLHLVALLFLSIASLGVLLWLFTLLDQWSLDRRHANEQAQLARLSSGFRTNGRRRFIPSLRPSNQESSTGGVESATRATSTRTRPKFRYAFLCVGSQVSNTTLATIAAISNRQWHCLVRYRWNVLISFAIPMVVSLSPLLTGDPDFAHQSTKQWIFVVGGISLSTLLLAPPALQIDFRRDLKRMSLLKSFPMSSLELCFGMLAVPVLVTSLFQWTTLAVACLIATPPIGQVVWLSAALPALALMTFAIENALFLAFPHHVHDQGLAMVIRAKVTFLWKGLILAILPLLLYAGSLTCMAVFPTSLCAVVIPIGSVIGFWGLAGLALLLCVRCWSRFNLTDDIPIEA